MFVLGTCRYYAIVCMLVGVLVFGYFFGSVTSSMANTDAPRARYAEKVTAIQKQMASTFALDAVYIVVAFIRSSLSSC